MESYIHFTFISKERYFFIKQNRFKEIHLKQPHLQQLAKEIWSCEREFLEIITIRERLAYLTIRNLSKIPNNHLNAFGV